eukprot:TRINITY_DN5373_c0_g1_i1.p2 TRINITY_DN5373_c0_g1~~TRINITY_DN5373_c0_g1_i1.p2  ORF type:complete len:186 (+),score=37.07 TRINITY_DN5373_c0_g1_i1:1168-1725(+)
MASHLAKFKSETTAEIQSLLARRKELDSGETEALFAKHFDALDSQLIPLLKQLTNSVSMTMNTTQEVEILLNERIGRMEAELVKTISEIRKELKLFRTFSEKWIEYRMDRDSLRTISLTKAIEDVSEKVDGLKESVKRIFETEAKSQRVKMPSPRRRGPKKRAAIAAMRGTQQTKMIEEWIPDSE